jgi:hypothetical protein
MIADGSRRSRLTGRSSLKLLGVALFAAATLTVTLELASGAAKPPKPQQPPKPPALTPPALTNPTTVEISDTNRNLHLEPGRDYVIRMPSTPCCASGGGVTLNGGRNVVIIGGEIFDDSPISPSERVSSAYGLYLLNQTGTVHLEGLWIHGRGIGQAIVLAQPRGATVHVQNSRLAPLHPVGHVHTDGIQSWAGPARLRMRNVTIRTAGVGIQTQPHTFDAVAIDRWEYWRVNVVQLTPDAYALWKGSGQGEWWREIHRDLWVKNLGNYAWPSARHWNPGGPALIEGEPIKRGIPPRGDFVQARIVGLRYGQPAAR